MYKKILNDPLVFGPEFGSEARSILTCLLTRDPYKRLGVRGAEEIKKHPFFEKHINFKQLLEKKIHPPFKPSVASPVVRACPHLIVLIANLCDYRMYQTSIQYSPRKILLTATSKIPIYRKQFKINFLV